MLKRDEYEVQAKAARAGSDPMALAYALRHLSELDRADDPDRALAQADEALALYRQARPDRSLDVANSLRLRALALDALARGEAAITAWREARGLYASAGVDAGVAECDRRLTEAG